MRNLSIGDIYLLLSKQLNSQGIAYLAFNGITGHDNSIVDCQAWEGVIPSLVSTFVIYLWIKSIH